MRKDINAQGYSVVLSNLVTVLPIGVVTYIGLSLLYLLLLFLLNPWSKTIKVSFRTSKALGALLE